MASSASGSTSNQKPSSSNPMSTILIVVRFTAAIPDVLLHVQPSKTTVVQLKHQIRNELAPPTSSHRLRLIYGGKLLSDNVLLPSILRIVPPPPQVDIKGKSKAADAEQSRIYINCSIGDALSAEELDAEAEAALQSSTSLAQDHETSETSHGQESQPALNTTTPAPRGFDRLLNTGFTPAEVGQLRLQFISIRAANYTPDAMPSPNTLRRMEDEWIDDNGATAAGGNEGNADVATGAIDDLIIGLVIGFIWPLGAMCWLIREEGVWSVRRQTAIWSGFMVCIILGLLDFLG